LFSTNVVPIQGMIFKSPCPQGARGAQNKIAEKAVFVYYDGVPIQGMIFESPYFIYKNIKTPVRHGSFRLFLDKFHSEGNHQQKSNGDDSLPNGNAARL
jgi:hypothetical protein